MAYQNFREKPELYYWHKEARASNAEVDYVTTIGSKIVPVDTDWCQVNYFFYSPTPRFLKKKVKKSSTVPSFPTRKIPGG